jgi:hypothetical protein
MQWPWLRWREHKQIRLVQNFAAQAVIAIENARLLNEPRQSLQQQNRHRRRTQGFSRSTFDLQKVLDTLVECAAELCRAERASITVPKGERYRCVAAGADLDMCYDTLFSLHWIKPTAGSL